MNSRKLFALSSGLLLGVTGVVHADTTTSDADLKAQVEQLKQRVNELEGKQSQDWLNTQRAAQVKALVKDVLSDADTRESLMANGMTAGYSNTFFLASENDDFRLNIDGLIQARYNYDHRRASAAGFEGAGDGAGTPDSSGAPNESSKGFEVARTEIDLFGHIVSPAWTYYIRLNADPEGSFLFAQMAYIGYQATDTVNVGGGRFKDAFMRESIVDDPYALAVDRSFTEGIFGDGFVQGLFVDWDVTDMVHLVGSVNNGPGSGNGAVTNELYNGSGNDVSVTGRADAKIMGDWKEEQTFSAFSDEETALFVGAAVNYTVAETGNDSSSISTPNTKQLSWTVDAAGKMNGANLSAAFVHQHLYADDNSPGSADQHDFYAAVVQGGYMVIPDKLEPFARVEWLHLRDHQDLSALNVDGELVTAGANYYIARHKAKLTVDATYSFVAVPNSNLQDPADANALDLLPDIQHSGQILLRAQVQLMF